SAPGSTSTHWTRARRRLVCGRRDEPRTPGLGVEQEAKRPCELLGVVFPVHVRGAQRDPTDLSDATRRLDHRFELTPRGEPGERLEIRVTDARDFDGIARKLVPDLDDALRHGQGHEG